MKNKPNRSEQHAHREIFSFRGPGSLVAAGHSLRGRLLWMSWAIVLVFFTLVVLTEVYWFQNRYQQETKNNLEVARVIGTAFGQKVQAIFHEEYAIGAARQELLPFDDDNFQSYLDRLSRSYTSVREFSVTDSSGRITAGSRKELVGVSVADRQYFKRVKAGDTAVVSNFLESKVNDEPGFVIGRAFYGQAGNLEFAVFAFIEAEKLGKILGYNRRRGEYFTLFDRRGTLIYTDQYPDTLTQTDRMWRDYDPVLRRALGGDEATGYFNAPIGPDGRRIGARVPIEEIGWVAGSAITVGNFFRPFIIPYVLILVLSIAVAAVTLLLANRTVDAITRSLGTVDGHMNRVAQGDFATIDAGSGLKEFDTLIENTNTMAQKLKDREEKLTGSEERFRGAIEGLLDAFIIITPVGDAVGDGRGAVVDYRFEYANRVALEFMELGWAEVVGRNLSEIFPPESLADLLPTYNVVVDTGEPAVIDDYLIRTPVGAFRDGMHIDIRATRVDTTLAIAWRDVTARVEAEAGLRQREANFRTLAQNSPEVIARLDRRLRYLFLNSYGEKVYGIPTNEAVGKTQAELGMPAEKVAFCETHLKEVLRRGEVRTMEFEFTGPTFGHQYFSSLLVPEYNDKNEIGSILAITRDITDLKTTELALRGSEERFRQLADSMPQLVWTATPDGTVDYYNQKYRDFGGISPGEDGVWEWGPVVHQDDLEATVDAWDHSVKTGETYQIEHRVRHVDGSFHWYLSRAFPARDQSGRITKWYGTATNVDISKESQAALEESENRLKLLNQNLEDMVVQRTEQVRELSKALTLAEQRERKRFSYILHENLQQQLLGAKMLLRQHVRDHQAAAEMKEFDDVAQGLSILESALRTTKTLSVEMNPPILRGQGLDAALEWLADHMRKNYGLSVDLRMEKGLGRIRNETQQMLTQMVRELLNNVRRHAGVYEAKVRAECAERRLRIVVSDTGRGFDVRESFREISDETQLGLFSIRERLRLFNGDLVINSAGGVGTECVLTLPVEKC